MAVSDEVHNARLTLGIKLAAAREAAKITQKQLARLTNYGRSSIANVETARQNVSRAFWVAADEILGTGHDLADAYDSLEVLVEQDRRRSAQVAAQEKLMGLSGGRGLTRDELVLDGDASLRWQNRSYPPTGSDHRATQRLTATGAAMATSPQRDSLILAVDERARELYIRGHGMLHGNQRHEIEAAQALLDRAVGRDPRLALAIADRGYTRWRQYFAGWTDRPEVALTGALRDVEAALAVDPDSVAAYGTFVRACWDMGWHQRALQAGRTIYLNRPNSLDATITYSRALMNAGIAELAFPLATAVLQDDPTHPAAIKLRIWCNLLLGHHERTIQAGRPYLAIHRGDANTRWAVALASAHLPFGIEEAVSICREALQADDSDLTVWLLLGYLNALRGGEIAAQKAWSEGAARIEQDGVGVNHRTAAWAANIYAALKDNAATMRYIDYLIATDGANGYIRYRLFHALAELGDAPAAVEMLDSAVTCGFMSLQLLRQEEILGPRHLRAYQPYRRVVARLEGVVRAAKDAHRSRQNIGSIKESVPQ